MKNKRIKIVFIALIIIAYSFINYISTPMVKALEARDDRVDLTNVKIITSEGPSTDYKNDTVKVNDGFTADSNTTDEIMDYINAIDKRGTGQYDEHGIWYPSGPHTYNSGYAWKEGLDNYKSLFCQASGVKLPSVNSRFLSLFHVSSIWLKNEVTLDSMIRYGAGGYGYDVSAYTESDVSEVWEQYPPTQYNTLPDWVEFRKEFACDDVGIYLEYREITGNGGGGRDPALERPWIDRLPEYFFLQGIDIENNAQSDESNNLSASDDISVQQEKIQDNVGDNNPVYEPADPLPEDETPSVNSSSGEVVHYDTVTEKELNSAREYKQTVYTNLKYQISNNTMPVGLAFMASYSEHTIPYENDPFQYALWIEINRALRKDNETIALKGRKLYQAGKGVEDLSNPTKPQLSKMDTEGELKTGTILDGDNYKIGPIYINDYSYGWSEEYKEFHQTNDVKNYPENEGLIAGIVDATLVLDNGKTITLTKDNFEYYVKNGVIQQNQARATEIKEINAGTNSSVFKVVPIWESPAIEREGKEVYNYPTPDSSFYIKIPRSECAGATKVNEIIFKYKYTTAEGTYYTLKGTCKQLTFTGRLRSIEDTLNMGYHCTEYTCPVCVEEHVLPFEERSQQDLSDAGYTKATPHDYWCGGSGYCFNGSDNTDEISGDLSGDGKCNNYGWACGMTEHEHDSSCYKKELDCSKETGHSHGDGCYDEEGNLTCTIEEHTHDSSCYRTTDELVCNQPEHDHHESGCKKKHLCTMNYCRHGHADGHHSYDSNGNCTASWSYEAHADKCYGTKSGTDVLTEDDKGTVCIHGHATCGLFSWTLTDMFDRYVQRLLLVDHAEVHELECETKIKDIPLIAKVEINKYVYDVEHKDSRTITGYDSTMQAGTTRSAWSDSDKLSNPVYAEYGDLVTFKIEISNNSAYGVKVIATDIIDPMAGAKFYKTTFSVNGGNVELRTESELQNQLININAGSKASFYVTYLVDTRDGEYINTAKLLTRNLPTDPDFKDYVRTIDDDGPIVIVKSDNFTPQDKWESKDKYKLNDYNLKIDKYVSSYDASKLNENLSKGFLNAEDAVIGSKFFNSPSGNITSYEDTIREGKDNSYKDNNPVEVEKGEKIVYSIKLTNEATNTSGNIAGGSKPGTQIRPSKIVDIMQNGLSYESVKGVIFNSGGSVKNSNVNVTHQSEANNTHVFSIDNNVILDPGDVMIMFVTVKIDISNMHLENLENTVFFRELTNINHDNTERRIVYEKPTLTTPSVDKNINPQEESKEYVKLKELIIAGKVFLDEDRDGYMNPENAENRFNNVTVYLYRVENGNETLVGQTKTGSSSSGNGFYTFGRVDKGPGKTNSTKESDYYSKGGKYVTTGVYEYYVEFLFDGFSYKATEVYGGATESTNPNYGDNNITKDWLPQGETGHVTDSNAYEFTDVRERFNRTFETFGYNKAYAVGEDANSGTGYLTLDYNKIDHISELVAVDPATLEGHPERAMRARTFIRKEVVASGGGYKDAGVNESLSNTRPLWLYQEEGNGLPETEYLKYINLGLVEREKVNVSLAKDVFSVRTTVNGEQITYDYNQNNVKNNELASQDNGKYIDNKFYKLDLYESDYYYRFEQYEHEAVRNYKTQYSELNIEVTFRIKITNEKIEDDEVGMEDTDREISVTIDEIADYYDENFIKLGSTDKVKIKVKENTPTAEDPTSSKLVDKELDVVKAWYNDGGTEKPLTVSNTSKYNPDANTSYTEDGYNKLYITGIEDKVLKEGESIDFYITYIVDKEDGTRNLKIKEKILSGLKDQFGRGLEGIAEVSAYSTWDEDGKPAAIVDKNSNPDNLGDGGQSADNVNYYEDDTYKTGINMKVPKMSIPDEDPSHDPGPDPTPDPDPDPTPDPNPTPTKVLRTIYGSVWDDSRSEPGSSTTANTQYSGNGLLQDTDTKNTNAEDNDNVRKNYKGGGLSEEKDIMVRNARVDLIEIVEIDGKYYEEVVKTGDSIVHQFTTRTDENGRYVLYGFKPGYYIVRFGYGDYVEGNEQATKDMAIFNGQDYKSTKYTSIVDGKTSDEIINMLEQEKYNDARDDEIDRLNAISYSEIMINQKAEALRGIYDTGEITPTVQALLNNTNMNAETVKFMVKPEKLTETQMSTEFSIGGTTHGGIIPNYVYDSLDNLRNQFINTRNFSIKNVDFGIEYRPESQVSLVKEIDNVSLKSSDGTELVRLYFDTIVQRDPNTGVITSRRHEINTSKSIGIEKTQFLTNEYQYREMRNRILDEGARQGFVYVNVDEEILQGSTVTIQYRFTAENISEIDRIGKSLDALRFKDNTDWTQPAYRATGTLKNMMTDSEYISKLDENWNKRFGFIQKALITDKIYKVSTSGEIIGTNNESANNYLYDSEYSGAGVASNLLVREMYKMDENKDIYRTKMKSAAYSGDANGYYGRYLGNYYYTAVAGTNDVVAQIKFDKILDYIDNDLVFQARENNEKNRYWGTTTADELRRDGYLKEEVFTKNKDESNNDIWQLVDNKKISYDSVKGGEILKTNLAVSVSDRTKDGDDTGVINPSLSRFLTPLVSNIAPGSIVTEETIGDINTMVPYAGQIVLTASKLLAGENKDDEMSYDNIAEVIQFTVTTGRRTNFITTVGNAEAKIGEWTTSTKETDTSATETITFTPPTGLTKTDRVIHEVVEKTTNGAIVIAIIAAVLVIIVVSIRFVSYKIRKRRIK